MKDYESESSSGLAWFFGGAVLGAVAALLFAPKAGEETRRDISDFIDENRQRGRELVNKAMDKLPGRGRAVVDAIKERATEARERLS